MRLAKIQLVWMANKRWAAMVFRLENISFTPSREGIWRKGAVITHYPSSHLSMRTVSYTEINSTLASAVILHYNCL